MDQRNLRNSLRKKIAYWKEQKKLEYTVTDPYDIGYLTGYDDGVLQTLQFIYGCLNGENDLREK